MSCMSDTVQGSLFEHNCMPIEALPVIALDHDILPHVDVHAQGKSLGPTSPLS